MNQTELAALIPFYKELTPKQIELILQTAHGITAEAGKIISAGGGSCQGFIIVKSGLIGASMISEDGREAELFTLGSGELCILSASCIFLPKTFHVQMTAEKTSQIIIIPSSTVEKLRGQNMHVELFAYKTMTARFADVMNAVEEQLFVPVEKRLAKILVSSRSDTIFITQEALAKKLGTAREVVSRTLSSFKARGFVNVKRGQIEITNKSALQKLMQTT